MDTNQLNCDIGIRIRKYRRARGWSMEALCHHLTNKITPQQMAKYEKGISRWPAVLVCEIAEIFKMDIKLLIEG
jgi:transcriptional regulator with XRE-family HTH domain